MMRNPFNNFNPLVIGYISVAMIKLQAADNPCVPDWQWMMYTPPSITITSPDTLPDKCLGEVVINATMTPTFGTKAEYDA